MPGADLGTLTKVSRDLGHVAYSSELLLVTRSSRMADVGTQADRGTRTADLGTIHRLTGLTRVRGRAAAQRKLVHLPIESFTDTIPIGEIESGQGRG